MAQTNLLKLDRVQKEAMRVMLGTTKDTPIETMIILVLPPVQTRHKEEQVKAYFSAVENPHIPPHEAVKDTGMQAGTGQVLDESSRGLSIACMPVDRAQAD